MLQTVVELPEFIRRVDRLMGEAERVALIDAVARDPQSGVSLGGGLRKMRMARRGQGKRGGFRLITIYGGNAMPVFLVTIFAKNERANLTGSEQAELVAKSKQLLDRYGV